MSARITLAAVHSSLQQNIHFSVSYDHPSLISLGRCSSKKGSHFYISLRVFTFWLHSGCRAQSLPHPLPCNFKATAQMRKLRSAPCWYSCLEPAAAATAGKTEALSGSVVPEVWGKDDIYLATVLSYGATKGHRRQLLLNRQGLRFP